MNTLNEYETADERERREAERADDKYKAWADSDEACDARRRHNEQMQNDMNTKQTSKESADGTPYGADVIRKEIAVMEAEANALWEEFQRVQAEVAPHVERQAQASRRWFESHRALESMKTLLARAEKRVLTDGHGNG